MQDTPSNGEPGARTLNNRWVRIILVAIIVYIIAFMDRTNIGFGFSGMQESLGFGATETGVAGGIFFIGYLFLQIPGGVTLSERLPGTWPGHMNYAHHNWNWFAEVVGPTGKTRSTAPYQTNFIVIDEHCGTHFDAPTHFVPPEGSGLPLAGPLGAETGHKVPPADLTGPAAVVDLRFLSEEGKPGVSPFITADHIRAWEEEHNPLKEREVVLLWMDWDRYYVEGEEGLKYMNGSLVTGDAPGWPAPAPEMVLYLRECGIKTIGIDAPSIGPAHDPIPVHQEGLSRGMRYVEVLTNFGELPVRGAYFVFLPLKIAGSSGGPGRAIALLPNSGE